MWAKRATFTFWVDKSSLKMPETINFGEFLKTYSFRSNSGTRHGTFKRTKIGGKCQNWKIKNATFWVIFKHCESMVSFKMRQFCRFWVTLSHSSHLVFSPGHKCFWGVRANRKRDEGWMLWIGKAISQLAYTARVVVLIWRMEWLLFCLHPIIALIMKLGWSAKSK